MKALTVCALVLVGLLAVTWGLAQGVWASTRVDEGPASLRGVLPGSLDDDHVFEAWLGDSIVLGRSPELEGHALPRFAGEPGEPEFLDIELPDGRAARAVAVRYTPPAPGYDALLSSLGPDGAPDEAGSVPASQVRSVEVVVAKPNDLLASTLRQLRWLLFATWILTTLLCAAGLAWVVRRGLGPLAELGDQIHAKDEADLGTPFALPEAAEELAPVVERLNGFRERVGDAIEREHSFAAHAAHELRTPLAGLRSTLEVSLSRERSAEEHRESEQASLEITNQLERLVARLLELSRAASPNSVLAHEPFDLRTLVHESWTPYSDAAADRGVVLETELEPGLEVTSDRQLLGRVLQNLFENASNYADEATSVRAAARASAGEVEIAVINTSSELDPEITRHAFEAFWRSDTARSAVGRHAGLGLSLCRDVIARLGGRIEVTGEDQTFRAAIRLPSGPGPQDEAR